MPSGFENWPVPEPAGAERSPVRPLHVVHSHNPAVPGIGDIDLAFGIERNAPRRRELLRARAGLTQADSVRADNIRGLHDAVVSRIGDIDRLILQAEVDQPAL